MADRRDASSKTLRGPAMEPTAAIDSHIRVLARAIYRELQKNGYTHGQIIAVIAELIACVLAETDAPA